MQTFRAYTQDAAGTITWAAWIEAAHSDEARRLADALCPGGSPSIDLWSVAAREIAAGSRLEPV